MSNPSEPESQHGVAHHGPPILTSADEGRCLAMAAWIGAERRGRGKEWLPSEAELREAASTWRMHDGVELPPPGPREVAICMAMTEWIRVAGKERNGADWLPGAADICKSRLFWRLRSGKPALPSPPPTAYSCPWYELIDEPGRPHWAYDLAEWGGETAVAQCRYRVLQRDDAGKPSRLAFGPYEFRVWLGKSPYSDHDGWWLQYEPVRREAAAASAR